MDVEGSEWGILTTMMERKTLPLIDTLSIECHRIKQVEYLMIGVSFGTMMGHNIALASDRLQGVRVRKFVMIDPLPPMRPWRFVRPAYPFRQCARDVALQLGGSDVVQYLEQFDKAAEEDLTVLLAERRAALGMSRLLLRSW